MLLSFSGKNHTITINHTPYTYTQTCILVSAKINGRKFVQLLCNNRGNNILTPRSCSHFIPGLYYFSINKDLQFQKNWVFCFEYYMICDPQLFFSIFIFIECNFRGKTGGGGILVFIRKVDSTFLYLYPLQTISPIKRR